MGVLVLLTGLFAWGFERCQQMITAIRESALSVRIYRDIKEKKGGGIDVGFQAEGFMW